MLLGSYNSKIRWDSSKTSLVTHICRLLVYVEKSRKKLRVNSIGRLYLVGYSNSILIKYILAYQ